MATFGQLIDVETPVLLCFYKGEQDNYHKEIQRNISARYGNSVKVIRIDIDKNEELSKALKVDIPYTYIIYNYTEIIARLNNNITEKDLQGMIEPLLI